MGASGVNFLYETGVALVHPPAPSRLREGGSVPNRISLR